MEIALLKVFYIKPYPTGYYMFILWVYDRIFVNFTFTEKISVRGHICHNAHELFVVIVVSCLEWEETWGGKHGLKYDLLTYCLKWD